jgi:hypothetical protein
MVSEIYANEPEKLKRMLNAIDDKIPDIMSGKVVLPPIKIKTVPERVAVITHKFSKDKDIENIRVDMIIIIIDLLLLVTIYFL